MAEECLGARSLKQQLPILACYRRVAPGFWKIICSFPGMVLLVLYQRVLYLYNLLKEKAGLLVVSVNLLRGSDGIGCQAFV